MFHPDPGDPARQAAIAQRVLDRAAKITARSRAGGSPGIRRRKPGNDNR
jgi:hypothetical protein